jgi:YVTN family beta-propeller protein
MRQSSVARSLAAAATIAIAAAPAQASDGVLFASVTNHLVALDLATGAERARFATPGTSADMMVTADGTLLLNHRDAHAIVMVDARTLTEIGRVPSSALGGRRPVHAYLTPTIGGRQFFVALNDGESTPGQPNTDNTALFIDVTPGSPTRHHVVGEVRLGQGHHKANFHPTLPRMAISNIADCTEILGVYDYAEPREIRRIAALDAAGLGLDGSSPDKTCVPAAGRPGVRPAPHGAGADPVSGRGVHNLNGTGQFVMIEMAAARPSFSALRTSGWGGAAIATHPSGRILYGPQYAPRVGDARAPGAPCQVGQIAVIDAAAPAIAAEIPVLKDGPGCTRSLAGTPAAGARVGYAVVTPDGSRLFLPLGTLGPASARSAAVAVFDLAVPAQPRQLPSISVGEHGGHRDVALTGDGRFLLVPANVANTVSVIDTATAEVVRTIAVPPGVNRLAAFSTGSGPSKPSGPFAAVAR